MSENKANDQGYAKIFFPARIQKRIDDGLRRRKGLGWPPADYESGLQVMFILMGGWPAWRKLNPDVSDTNVGDIEMSYEQKEIYALNKEVVTYRNESLTLTKTVEQKNIENAQLKEERDTYRRALRTFPHCAEDDSVRRISLEVTEKYPQKEEPKS